MAVLSWYLVTSDLFSLCYCTPVHFLQGTRNTRPCITGEPVPESDLAPLLLVGVEGVVGHTAQTTRALNGESGGTGDFSGGGGGSE